MIEGNESSAMGSNNQDNAARGSMWSSAGGMMQISLDIVLVIMVFLNLYWVKSTSAELSESAKLQSDQYSLLSRRLEASDDQSARLSGELKVTTEKLGLTEGELNHARTLTASIRKQQQESVKQLNDAIAQKAGAEELNQLQSAADQKFTSLSGDIDKTNEALSGAKGELNGAIAKTHDELVVLAHKSDRDYFEFKLANKGARDKVGGVMVELDKTDSKRNRFTVNLYFDDKRVQLKDKGYMEPVMFYVAGASSPIELVVNQLGRNTVSGYLSAPKGLYAGIPNVLSERPGA